MIHIHYTGTIDREQITAEDKDELMQQIVESIKEKVEVSIFEFCDFGYSESVHLSEGKVCFSAMISLIPNNETEAIPSESK